MEYVQVRVYRGYERSESDNQQAAVFQPCVPSCPLWLSPNNKASAVAEASIKLAALLLLGLCGLSGVRLRILPAEALHASGGIHQLLLAGKERVAVRADFQVDGALVGGPGGKCVSACAVHAHFFIFGMDRCLHCL
jgi:hypothetical protein